jgi:hypothetical protein
MLTLTLGTLRRLLGALRTGADDHSAAPDLIFRLKSWPRLGDGLRTVEVYRMLSLLSHRPLSRRWLHSNSGIAPQQLEPLLEQLARTGALEVIDPSQFAAEPLPAR